MNKNKTNVYCTFQDAQQHKYKDHPESPKRLHLIKAWQDDPPYPEIHWLDFSPADEADVLLIHHKVLLEDLKLACQQGPHEFEPSPSYVTRASYVAALEAVGATLAVSQRIISEGKGYGFAVVRPPGHHAEPSESMGFCLMNNIAIAAADAVASGVRKVAIVDFDAHHGNGIQAAFWNTPQVGYFSTHEKNMYPGTGQNPNVQHARGRIINIPLPHFSGNHAFEVLLVNLLEPWIKKFAPEMIFVAAGYDAHFSDPLTTLTLDTSGFFQISKKLVRLAETYCDSRMMFVLEGGYDPVALHDNIQASLAAMCGHEHFDDHYGKGPGVSTDVKPLIEDIKKIHQL